MDVSREYVDELVARLDQWHPERLQLFPNTMMEEIGLTCAMLDALREKVDELEAMLSEMEGR